MSLSMERCDLDSRKGGSWRVSIQPREDRVTFHFHECLWATGDVETLIR